ncbi:DUF3519 domain-containing protein [Helicobacter pylori]|nr:DUF3519 domain-containing protein [Helicobacter pylori]
MFKGELDQTEIKGIDLNDLYILDQGTRHAGAKKILVKHYGVENTGGLTNEELINMSEVIKNGSVLLESFERLKNGFRYGYEWENNGVKLRLVVDDLNDGNKIFDFYSDRNFKDFRDARPQPSTSKDNGTQPITLDENNPTQKPLNSQEDLLKRTENLNETTQEVKNLSPLEQANAEKLLKLQHAITPLKEFGKNYPEFDLKPKEALEKLLQEKNGQVAGAAYREDLGGIDLVWGNKDYGLEHILKRREDQAIGKGLNETEAKEYALNVVKSIPEIIEKGVKVDNNGRIAIEYQHMRVGLNDKWDNQKLENKWVVSSYEIYNSESESPFLLMTQLQEVGLGTPKLTEPNPTTNTIKTQEHLSPLEQANAEKLAKLETEKENKAEAVKKLDFDGIKKLIDESPRTGSSMPILGMQNLNAEAVEYIQKNHKRIAVEKIEPSFAKDLKLKYPDDARAVIDYQAINHILKEHKNLAYEDIANYRELSKQANETLKLKDNQNRPVVASFNQINGFFVVVEQVSNAKNELMLKTMYKARGNYKDSLIYKKTLAKSQNSN